MRFQLTPAAVSTGRARSRWSLCFATPSRRLCLDPTLVPRRLCGFRRSTPFPCAPSGGSCDVRSSAGWIASDVRASHRASHLFSRNFSVRSTRVPSDMAPPPYDKRASLRIGIGVVPRSCGRSRIARGNEPARTPCERASTRLRREVSCPSYLCALLDSTRGGLFCPTRGGGVGGSDFNKA